MPLIIKDESNSLEMLFRMAIDIVSVGNLREFGKGLTRGQLEMIPEKATCDFAWVVTCIISTVSMEDVKLIAQRSRNPFTAAIAWTYGKDITFNTRKRHSLESVAKTIVHELTHIGDKNDAHSFGHGSNYNQDKKQDCAPMVAADLFWKFIKTKTEDSYIQLTPKKINL